MRHVIAGYDREDGKFVREYPISTKDVEYLKTMVDLDPEDEEMVFSYDVDFEVAEVVLDRDLPLLDYFVECEE